MTLRFATFPALLICALCVQVNIAPATNATETTARLQKQYADLKGFTADFEQTLLHKESGAVEKRSGTLRFQKPLLIRWETGKPHRELMIVTNNEIWNYLPDEELVYRYPLSMIRDSRGLIQVITGQTPLTRDFDVKPDGREENLEKFRLYPKEAGMEMIEAIIWVDEDSGFIKRAESVDFYGNKNALRFTSFSLQTKFKEDEFSFTPPKGVDVENVDPQGAHRKKLFN
jgi:outer membrane lipoprotein carrier protein